MGHVQPLPLQCVATARTFSGHLSYCYSVVLTESNKFEQLFEYLNIRLFETFEYSKNEIFKYSNIRSKQNTRLFDYSNIRLSPMIRLFEYSNYRGCQISEYSNIRSQISNFSLCVWHGDMKISSHSCLTGNTSLDEMARSTQSPCDSKSD